MRTLARAGAAMHNKLQCRRHDDHDDGRRQLCARWARASTRRRASPANGRSEAAAASTTGSCNRQWRLNFWQFQGRARAQLQRQQQRRWRRREANSDQVRGSEIKLLMLPISLLFRATLSPWSSECRFCSCCAEWTGKDDYGGHLLLLLSVPNLSCNNKSNHL